MNDPDEPLNSDSRIDKVSRKVFIFINRQISWQKQFVILNIKVISQNENFYRIVFQLSFLVINIMYWNDYFHAGEEINLTKEEY